MFWRWHERPVQPENFRSEVNEGEVSFQGRLKQQRRPPSPAGQLHTEDLLTRHVVELRSWQISWLKQTSWETKEFNNPSHRTLLIFYFSTNKCIWLPAPFSLLIESVNQKENGQEHTEVGRRNERPRFSPDPLSSLIPRAWCEVWGPPFTKLHKTDVQADGKC